VTWSLLRRGLDLVRYTSVPRLYVPVGTSLKPDTNPLCARVRLRERWYNSGMTSLLDDAIEVLRSLPENVQAAAARTIIDSVANYEDQRLSV
jgi:hypothetical protein